VPLWLDPKEMFDADGKMLPLHLMPEHVRRAIASVDASKRRRSSKGKVRAHKGQRSGPLWSAQDHKVPVCGQARGH
jgi:hypothetical protein